MINSKSSFFPVAPATLIVFVGTRTGTAIHPEQQAHRSAILTVPLSRIRKLFFGMTVPSSEFAPRDQSLDFHNRGERLAIYLTLLHRKCGGQKLLESFAIEAGMGREVQSKILRKAPRLKQIHLLLSQRDCKTKLPEVNVQELATSPSACPC